MDEQHMTHKTHHKKPVILNIVDQFLPRTQTFIYNYLTASHRTEPFVLANSRINEREFPFANIKIISKDPAPKRSWLKRWTRSYDPPSSIASYKEEVASFVKQLHPALIHNHFGPTGYEMLWLKDLLSIPFITTFYGCDMSVIPREDGWMKRYEVLFEEGDLFLVEGPHMRDKLIELGAPEHKVEIQRVAIPTEKYPEWNPTHKIPTILFVGRLVEKKGLIYALEAVKKLSQEAATVRFLVIGDGPERARVMKYVHEGGMQKYVKFLGRKSHSKVIRQLKAANVYIQPSLTAQSGDSEGGAPTTLLEAQAIGVPIVSTYHADIPNITGGSDGVLLCRERDANELAAHLKTALKAAKSPDNSFVLKHHNVKNEVKHLEDKYLNLTENQRCLARARRDKSRLAVSVR